MSQDLFNFKGLHAISNEVLKASKGVPTKFEGSLLNFNKDSVECAMLFTEFQRFSKDC